MAVLIASFIDCTIWIDLFISTFIKTNSRVYLQKRLFVADQAQQHHEISHHVSTTRVPHNTVYTPGTDTTTS